MNIKYKPHNGTHYHESTSQEVIDVLERCRRNGTRIRIYLGEVSKGGFVPWHEEYDVVGHVGRSTGKIKVPLLLPKSNSTGGGAILDHCIVRIREANGDKADLYRHPAYLQSTFHVREIAPGERVGRTRLKDMFTCCVQINGKDHARFTSVKGAQAYINHMR